MPSSSEALVADLEAGLCASWARQVALSGGGALRRVGGLLVALSAVPDQTQQVAVVERPVVEPLPAVVAAEALFGGAGWNPAFDLVAGARPSLERVLSDRGYRVVAERVGMVRLLDDRPAAPAGAPPIRPASVPQLVELAEVQGRAFRIAPAIAAMLLPPSSVSTPGLQVLVATDADGSVLGGLTLHLDGAIAGIVGAGVDPVHQRLGIGGALAAAALATAQRSGARAVWLQSTDEGRALWQGQGFTDIGICQVWLVSHDTRQELHPSLRPTGL